MSQVKERRLVGRYFWSGHVFSSLWSNVSNIDKNLEHPYLLSRRWTGVCAHSNQQHGAFHPQPQVFVWFHPRNVSVLKHLIRHRPTNLIQYWSDFTCSSSSSSSRRMSPFFQNNLKPCHMLYFFSECLEQNKQKISCKQMLVMHSVYFLQPAISRVNLE